MINGIIQADEMENIWAIIINHIPKLQTEINRLIDNEIQIPE